MGCVSIAAVKLLLFIYLLVGGGDLFYIPLPLQYYLHPLVSPDHCPLSLIIMEVLPLLVGHCSEGMGWRNCGQVDCLVIW